MSFTVVADQHPGQKSAKSVLKRRLADRVNQLNFLGDAVTVQFSHPRYGHTISVTADPLPCAGETLELRWRDGLPENISQYVLSDIILPGSRAFVLRVENVALSAGGMSGPLPKQGMSLPERKCARLKSLAGIKATLTQHSIRFEGFLTDFSAHSIGVRVTVDKPNSRYWITPEQPVHLTLEGEQGVILSGDMTVIRTETDRENQAYILAQADLTPSAGTTRHYRSQRMCLLPEPSLALRHPLTGRRSELNVVDLSGLGVCVEVSPEQTMLLPGMILPEMRIKMGSGFAVPCRGQVVYRTEPDREDKGARCGIALLDIDIQDHLRLLSLLQRARNRNAHLSTEVDIETLWEFFFETGFIYPSKYRQLAERKEGFLETFRRTYLEQTPIARHFTFQAEGQIMAHLSAVRLYEKTWFQQHHAARRVGKHAIGFEVIQQLAEYFYNAFSLSNNEISYVAGFYRPENRFPAKYFREIVRQLADKKAASLDLFAYFAAIPEFSDHWSWAEIPPAWQMARTTRGDLVEFNGFYEQSSGGCMVDALDLRPDQLGRTVIEEEYRKLGMVRRRHLYSIKRDQELMAIIDLHEADTGLSLSRMDRVVMCYVLRDELPPTLLAVLAKSLAGKLNLDQPPMMIYPRDYTARHGIEYDKNYEMMILNMFYAEGYMHFLDRFVATHGSVR
ncbi:MAG TPA: hypothetical protein VGA63_05660 [Geopsychrobacteraceae bacterium]|jgi:hypothetical protein